MLPRTLPPTMPRLERAPIVLRAFEPRDHKLVASVAADPLIPLITIVPSSGSAADIEAYLRRQHDRLRDGEGIPATTIKRRG